VNDRALARLQPPAAGVLTRDEELALFHYQTYATPLHVSQQMEITPYRARQLVDAALDKLIASHDRRRQQMLDIVRIDTLIAAHWPDAMKGYADSTRQVINLIKQRADMLGLGYPDLRELPKQMHRVAAPMLRKRGK